MASGTPMNIDENSVGSGLLEDLDLNSQPDSSDSNNTQTDSNSTPIDSNSTSTTSPTEPIDHPKNEEERKLLVACRKLKHLDGKYFTVNLTKSVTENKVFAHCNNCNKVIQSSLSCTSNNLRHIKTSHDTLKDEYTAYKPPKIPRLDEERACTRVTCKFDQTLFHKDVILFLLDNMLPVRIVENASFRRIFDHLKIKHGDRPLQHLSRHKANQEIDKIYDELMSEVKKALEQTRFVCTTVDVWTSSRRRFLGLTVSWIDEKSLSRKSAVVACKKLSGTHSFDNIANSINSIHTSVGLDPEKIVATISDNGSNFVKAFKIFGIDSFEEFVQEDLLEQADVDLALIQDESAESSDLEEIDSDEEDNLDSDEGSDNNENYRLPHHLRCASHSLNLISTSDTQKAMDKCTRVKIIHKSVIKKCEVIWKSLRSPKKRELLRNFLGCSIQRPVITRWNSLYDCLQQIYSLRVKLMCYDFLQILQVEELLMARDMEYISEYLQWTKPLATAIDNLQAEENNFYGHLLPTILMIKKDWQEMLDNNTLKFSAPVVEELIESLFTRFKDLFTISNHGEFAAIATMTHPLFKIKWINILSLDSQKKVKQLVERISPRQTIEVSTVQDTTKKNYFDFGDVSNNPIISSLTHQVEEANELKKFFASKSSSLDVLNEFPFVKSLFLKYNTALPSSASVERFFCLVTLLDVPKNNRLLDSKFEKRVVCKANAQNKFK